MGVFSGSGRARPSKAMSWLTAAVGAGMVVCVALLFLSPALGGGLFVLLWLAVVVALVAYHVRNAIGRGGVPHTEFSFRGGGDGRADFAARLRELERLRADGLVGEDEYRRKRADILGDKW